MGYEEGEDYFELALSQTLVTALSKIRGLASALPLLNPGDDAQAEEPVDPKQELPFAKSLQAAALKSVSLQDTHIDLVVAAYLERMIKQHRRAKKNDAAVIKLASVIRLPKTDIEGLERYLVAAGATTKQVLQTTLAYVVLDVVRATPSLVTGLKWAQPKKDEQDE